MYITVRYIPLHAAKHVISCNFTYTDYNARMQIILCLKYFF